MEEVGGVSCGSLRRFLQEFTSHRTSPISDDDVQVRTAIAENNFLQPQDVYCEVLDWALSYLEQRKCPYTVAVVLAKQVAEDMSSAASEQVASTNGTSDVETEKPLFESLHLHSQVINHLHDLCDHWWDQPDLVPTSSILSRNIPYTVSVCAIKNGRRKMEDRHVVLHDLNAVCDLADYPQHSYYAVFDGHAGVDAASYAAAHLHMNIVQHPSFLSRTEVAIKEAFKITDAHFLERSTRDNIKSGCTAVCCLVRERTIYLAWLGDSQAILVRQGMPINIMSPHKPDRHDEKQRIEDLGGYVLYVGTWRVNGTLAVSRALGDPEYKPYVSSEADVVQIELDGTEDFLVLACDGLWDRLDANNVTAMVYHYVVDNPSDPEGVANHLVQHAKDQGSSDNITTIVVFLKDIPSVIATARSMLSAFPYHAAPADVVNGVSQNGGQNPFAGEATELSNAYPSVGKDGSAPNPFAGEPRRHLHPDEPGFPDSCGFAIGDPIGANGPEEIFCPANDDAAVETTELSELPTPTIDEVMASRQLHTNPFGDFQTGRTATFEQFDTEARDEGSQAVVSGQEVAEVASEIVATAIESAVNVVLPLADQEHADGKISGTIDDRIPEMEPFGTIDSASADLEFGHGAVPLLPADAVDEAFVDYQDQGDLQLEEPLLGTPSPGDTTETDSGASIPDIASDHMEWVQKEVSLPGTWEQASEDNAPPCGGDAKHDVPLMFEDHFGSDLPDYSATSVPSHTDYVSPFEPDVRSDAVPQMLFDAMAPEATVQQTHFGADLLSTLSSANSAEAPTEALPESAKLAFESVDADTNPVASSELGFPSLDLLAPDTSGSTHEVDAAAPDSLADAKQGYDVFGLEDRHVSLEFGLQHSEATLFTGISSPDHTKEESYFMPLHEPALVSPLPKTDSGVALDEFAALAEKTDSGVALDEFATTAEKTYADDTGEQWPEVFTADEPAQVLDFEKPLDIPQPSAQETVRASSPDPKETKAPDHQQHITSDVLPLFEPPEFQMPSPTSAAHPVVLPVSPPEPKLDETFVVKSPGPEAESPVTPVKDLVEPVVQSPEVLCPLDLPTAVVQPLDIAVQPTMDIVQPPDIAVQPTTDIVQPLDNAVQPTMDIVQPIDIAIQPTMDIVQPIDVSPVMALPAEPLSFAVPGLPAKLPEPLPTETATTPGETELVPAVDAGKESQTGVDRVVLDAIPDSVPEAEGVTEDVDSDSEKDGGWSYIKGEHGQEGAAEGKGAPAAETPVLSAAKKATKPSVGTVKKAEAKDKAKPSSEPAKKGVPAKSEKTPDDKAKLKVDAKTLPTRQPLQKKAPATGTAAAAPKRVPAARPPIGSSKPPSKPAPMAPAPSRATATTLSGTARPTAPKSAPRTAGTLGSAARSTATPKAAAKELPKPATTKPPEKKPAMSNSAARPKPLPTLQKSAPSATAPRPSSTVAASRPSSATPGTASTLKPRPKPAAAKALPEKRPSSGMTAPEKPKTMLRSTAPKTDPKEAKNTANKQISSAQSGLLKAKTPTARVSATGKTGPKNDTSPSKTTPTAARGTAKRPSAGLKPTEKTAPPSTKGASPLKNGVGEETTPDQEKGSIEQHGKETEGESAAEACSEPKEVNGCLPPDATPVNYLSSEL